MGRSFQSVKVQSVVLLRQGLPWADSVPHGDILGDGKPVCLIRRIPSKRSNMFVVHFVPSVNQVRICRVSSCFDMKRQQTVLTVVRIGLVRWSRDTSRPVLQVGPGFVGTDKMDRIDLVTVSSISGGVRVSRCGSDVVPSRVSYVDFFFQSAAAHVKESLFHCPPPPSSENHSFSNP